MLPATLALIASHKIHLCKTTRTQSGKMINKLLLGLAALAGLASALDLNSVQEGYCLPFKPAQNVNMTWLANTQLPYISAGSKYHLFRLISTHPQFSEMKEHDFYYQACLQDYVNMTSGVGLVYGFGGGILGNYHVSRVEGEKGVIDFTPLPEMADVSRQVITLTDNKNFVFFANCWQNSNQRSWDVISRTPTLDLKTQKLIEDHAESLGFFKDQMVFLRYESCSLNNPVPGSNSENPSERAVGGKVSQAMLVEQKMKRRGRRYA